MTKHPVALAIALALSVPVALSGCDSTANLTEQEHIQRAKDFEDKDNLKGSIVELKNAIQKNPDSPQARLLLGQVYLKAGMGDEAEKELTRAAKLGVNSELIKPQLGEALLLMGEYKRVLDEIQPGEQTSQANRARIFQVRADALLRQGNLKESCDLFQQSHALDKAYPPAYWGLAQCAVAERDMVKAKALLDAALKIKDRQAKTWILLGGLEQLNSNAPGAINAYENALKLEPNNLEALQNHATLSMTLGKWEVAKSDIDKILKLAPKSLPAYYIQALFNFEQKKYPEARDALQEIFKTDPNHMPSILLAGFTAYALGAYQQAESYLNRFLEKFPRHQNARRMLAATQIKQNQPENALETLAPLLSSDSADPQAFALAGEAYDIKNESALAVESLTKAAAVSPKNASIHSQLGFSLLSMGDSQSAIKELQTAASLDAGQNKADVFLILVYFDQREYDKALVLIDELAKKRPNSPIPHNLRGKAYLGKNDVLKARKSFEQALIIDPAYFSAASSLALLDLRDKNTEAARKRFESVLSNDKNNLQAMMALAELSRINGAEKSQVDWLEKAVKTHPDAMTPRTALVRHFLGKNESKKALVIANEAVSENPENLDALALLGSVQLAVNDKSNAITTFTKLSKKADQSPDAFLRLALAQIENQEFSAARKTLHEALKLDPNHLQSQDALLQIDLAENKLDAAIKIARQIQAQKPASVLGYEREADVLLAQQRLPQAAKAYELALEKGGSSAGLIKLHQLQTRIGLDNVADQHLKEWLIKQPSDNAVRTYAAEYYMYIGRNKEAIGLYQAILRQAPKNAVVLNNLATLYQREKDGRAAQTASLALKLAPDNPAMQDTLGWILVEQGQAQRGLPLLGKALASAPREASIRYHYAVALARTGDKVQARKVLDKLLTDSPNFSEAEAAKALLKTL